MKVWPGKAPSDATFQPNRSAKNRRVASGSADRISAWTTGWVMAGLLQWAPAAGRWGMTGGYAPYPDNARQIPRSTATGRRSSPRHVVDPRDDLVLQPEEGLPARTGEGRLVGHPRRPDRR